MMHIEFELKFLGIDHDDLQHKIITHGGELVSPITLMRRLIFDLPGEGEFIRVRDEGDKITMTYKKISSQAIDGVKEINITIDDYESAVGILKAGGLIARSYQESYRSVYELDQCEICFDRWPGINEYIEIEGPTQLSVENVIEKLGLDISQGFGGAVNAIYQKELGLGATEIDRIPELTFANPPKSKL